MKISRSEPVVQPVLNEPDPSLHTTHSLDKYEHSTGCVDAFVPSQESSKIQPDKSYVTKSDIPGIFTFNWLAATAENLASKGDYSGPMGRAFGGLMVLASPVVIPFCLAADLVNTAIFPAKVIYRALV